MDLRSATEADRDLLWELQRTAMRPSVEATWGWDEEFQTRWFEEHFSTEDARVVEVDGERVGVLRLTIEDDHVFLTTVALLPGWQGRGLGTALVLMVLEEARRLDLPVRLQVLKTNRARVLYERLGFEAHGETETHVLMCRPAGGPAEPL